MKHPPLTDIKALKAQAISRMYELLQKLMPDRIVVSTADGFRIGNRGSLSVSSDGLFNDFEADKGGDVIDMVEHCLHTDTSGAINFLKWFLGQAPASPPVTLKAKTPRHTSSERITKALRIWNASTLELWVSEQYLNRRGIYQWPDGVLRYHPRLWNFTTNAEHPALVAAIRGLDGNIIAVHAIFLTPDGHKITGEGVEAKLMFGCPSGGAVRLGEPAKQLIVCEGLEDGLTLKQAMPDSLIWVGCGTSGLMHMHLPSSVKAVTIARDNDPAGENAANQLAERLKKESRVASIATPAPFKDFNELLVKGNIACLTA